MVTIIPSPIPASFTDLSLHLRKVKDLVSLVQIDVIDGIFAPHASWPYNGTEKDAWSRLASQEEALPYWELLEFEVDLMVEKPEEKVDDWISAGVGTMIVHVESTSHIGDIIERAKNRGAEVALALKPSTSIELLAPWIGQIKFIQQMGSDKIGEHGVALDPKVPQRVRELASHYPDVAIGIDIGVSHETIPILSDAGASRFASYSAVYTGIDIAENIRALSAVA